MRPGQLVSITTILATTFLMLGTGRCMAGQILAVHQGDTDPTTEGFTARPVVGTSSVGPLANDLGLPAWQIAGASRSSQFEYRAPGLTSSQKADIASQGFTMTIVARVLQNGLAPPYQSSDPVTIGGATVNYAGVRWEVDLGINSNGDTVVVLPNTLFAQGPGGSVQSFGPSYTLTGSGSTYHTYELHYDPATNQADLSVDGVVEISNYTGETRFYYESALAWAAHSGGAENFNLVESQIGVPEPAAVTLLLFGLVGALFQVARCRRSVSSP